MSRSDLKHSFRQGKRFINDVNNAVATASKFMRAARGVGTTTGTPKEGASGAITGQHDSRMLYKRRRAPKRIRSKFRRKAQRFLKNQLNNKSSSTNLFSRSQNFGNEEDEQEVFTIVSGYTWCGIGTTSNDRVGNVYEVCQNIEAADPAGIAKDWYLTGMSTDYTLRNTSASESMELDVYEFVYRKDLEYQNANITTTSMIIEANDEEVLLPGATTKIVATELGWVPTDANKAMRSILIKSKQRFYISAGNAISFTKRTRFFRPVKYVSTDFKIRGADNQVDMFTSKAGVTRGIICVMKGLPTNSLASAQVTLAYNAQTRYTIKQVDRESDKHAHGF